MLNTHRINILFIINVKSDEYVYVAFTYEFKYWRRFHSILSFFGLICWILPESSLFIFLLSFMEL